MLCSWLRYLVVVLLVLPISGCEPMLGGGLVSARVDDVTIRIAVAKDEDSRRQGLMGRESMEQDEGMLLVFPKEKIIRLWMLNTHLPLDAGFFDKDGVMVGIVSMTPDGGKQIHQSPAPAVYALEMNRGWFAQNDIKPGAKLYLPYKIEGR